MKYLNSIYKLLLEFVDPYQWKLSDDDVNITKYEFTDAFNNKYLVEFKNIKIAKNIISNEYELVYFVFDEERQSYSVSKLVKGNPYRTIQTILGEIIHDFLRRNRWVKVVRMEGLSKEIEREYVSQRTKMYVRYLTMNPIDGYRLENYGNRINLIKV